MTTYIKSITFGPVSGGLKVSPNQVDPVVNEILEAIQKEGGKVLDVKISQTAVTPGSHAITYMIAYDASKPLS
jgi:hypothetical protein